MNQPENCHFFAASFCTWMTTTDKRDLRQLIKAMEKEKFSYNLYFVPTHHDVKYDIKTYQPQVDGTQWLGFYETK